jgi:hypothetical protein
MALIEQVQAAEAGLDLSHLPDLRVVDSMDRAAEEAARTERHRKQLLAETRQDYIASTIVGTVSLGLVETAIHDVKANIIVGAIGAIGLARTLRNCYRKDLAELDQRLQNTN